MSSSAPEVVLAGLPELLRRDPDPLPDRPRGEESSAESDSQDGGEGSGSKYETAEGDEFGEISPFLRRKKDDDALLAQIVLSKNGNQLREGLFCARQALQRLSASEEKTADAGASPASPGTEEIPFLLPELQRQRRVVSSELSKQILERAPQFAGLWGGVSRVGNDLARLRILAKNARRTLRESRGNLVLTEGKNKGEGEKETEWAGALVVGSGSEAPIGTKHGDGERAKLVIPALFRRQQVCFPVSRSFFFFLLFLYFFLLSSFFFSCNFF
jgi:hypothetical protein